MGVPRSIAIGQTILILSFISGSDRDLFRRITDLLGAEVEFAPLSHHLTGFEIETVRDAIGRLSSFQAFENLLLLGVESLEELLPLVGG